MISGGNSTESQKQRLTRLGVLKPAPIAAPSSAADLLDKLDFYLGDAERFTTRQLARDLDVPWSEWPENEAFRCFIDACVARRAKELRAQGHPDTPALRLAADYFALNPHTARSRFRVHKAS